MSAIPCRAPPRRTGNDLAHPYLSCRATPSQTQADRIRAEPDRAEPCLPIRTHPLAATRATRCLPCPTALTRCLRVHCSPHRPRTALTASPFVALPCHSKPCRAALPYRTKHRLVAPGPSSASFGIPRLPRLTSPHFTYTQRSTATTPHLVCHCRALPLLATTILSGRRPVCRTRPIPSDPCHRLPFLPYHAAR